MSTTTLFTTPPSTTTTTTLSPPSNHHPRPEKLAILLNKCQNLTHLLQIHAVILRQGYQTNHLLNFKLQKSYTSLGNLHRSVTLFQRTQTPNVFMYSNIINAHTSRGLHHQALCFYIQMLNENVEPNEFTFSSLLKHCSIQTGVLLHSQVIKFGFDEHVFVGTGLLDIYAKGGDLVAAHQVFNRMSQRSLVSLTAMLTCYAKHGELDDARKFFYQMEEKDVVCWNVLIDGYAQHGRPNEALALFRRMLKEKMKPDQVTVLSVLSSCGQLGSLEFGKWIHSYIVSNGINVNVQVGTALVDMYGKCGSVELAKSVFDEIVNKDVVAWNSMIVCYAMHGFSHEALFLFDEMCKIGVRPSDITFIGVLNACAHAGLVSEGKKIFSLMEKSYDHKPKLEHYGCMANLLGRAGHLDEAYDLIKSMDADPDPVLWGTLLGTCKLHGNVALAEEIAAFLLSKNQATDGTYVLLSNVYAALGNWDGVAKVRTLMRDSGIQKEPGCSSIEVNNKIYEFLAGDLRHPKSKEIYSMLEEIEKKLQAFGYSPQIETVLHDVGEKEKARSLRVHSERLAIAFGLINTLPGTTIKIVKNLRVCSDCHTVTKLITKITGRKIVVRDRNRFHHFENGTCSCGDYW